MRAAYSLIRCLTVKVPRWPPLNQVPLAVDGNEEAILYIADFDYLRCQTVDDSIPVNELVVGIHPMQGMFLNVRAAAGTYKKGQPLSIANGQVKAHATGESIRAYVEEDKAYTVVAGDLLRVVIK